MNGELSYSTNGDRVPNHKPIKLQDPSDIGLLHPATERNREQEYQLRLLSLYMDEVKQTGLIDYPELLQYLDQVFEVDNAPLGTVLMPATIDTLVANLQVAQADIHVSSVQIQHHLGELAQAIRDRHVNNPEENELDHQIRQESQRLLKAIEYLLNVTHHYVYTHQVRASQVSKQNVLAEDIESEWIRKLMNDLKYIRQYIAEQAQVQVIKSELLPEDTHKGYFRRLYKYLEIAPGLADILGNLVQQTLEHKVAGGEKFTTPKPY